MTLGKHRVWVLSFGFWVNGLSSLGDLGAFQFDPLCALAVLGFCCAVILRFCGFGF